MPTTITRSGTAISANWIGTRSRRANFWPATCPNRRSSRSLTRSRRPTSRATAARPARLTGGRIRSPEMMLPQRRWSPISLTNSGSTSWMPARSRKEGASRRVRPRIACQWIPGSCRKRSPQSEGVMAGGPPRPSAALHRTMRKSDIRFAVSDGLPMNSSALRSNMFKITSVKRWICTPFRELRD